MVGSSGCCVNGIKSNIKNNSGRYSCLKGLLSMRQVGLVSPGGDCGEVVLRLKF